MKRKLFFLITVFLLLLNTTGCTDAENVNKEQKTYTTVAQELLSKYQNKDLKEVAKCYGLDGELTQKQEEEIRYGLDLFEAINAKDIEVIDVEEISRFDDYIYLCVSYDMIFEDGTNAPYFVFLIAKKDGNSYKLVCSDDVPEKYSAQLMDAQVKSFQSNTYLKFKLRYTYFTENYPDFAEIVTKKRQEVSAKSGNASK